MLGAMYCNANYLKDLKPRFNSITVAIYCNAKYLKDLKPWFNFITVVSAEAVFF